MGAQQLGHIKLSGAPGPPPGMGTGRRCCKWKKLEETRVAVGKNCNMEKEGMGGSICKCALQVNDFYMKVWNFTSSHPTPNSPESRLLGVSTRGASEAAFEASQTVGSWRPEGYLGGWGHPSACKWDSFPSPKSLVYILAQSMVGLGN